MNLSNLKSTLFTKKCIALALVGTFAVGGIALATLSQPVANAATKASPAWNCPRSEDRPDFCPQLTIDEMAANMEECFGIPQQSILDHHNQGWKMHDLHQAAFIASASGKQLSEVLNAKTTTNTWKDVSDSFGITSEQSRELRQKLLSNRIAKSTDMDKSTIEQLISNGYRPHDIVMANALSKQSGKDTTTILGMKQINNHWRDVANKLGIDEPTYQQCRQEMQNCFDSNRRSAKHGRGFHQGNNNGYGGHHNRMNWDE